MYPRNMQKEHINLSQTDHDFLMTIVSRGHTSARVFRRATALLELNRGKTLAAIAKTLGVSRQTVSQWCNNYHSSGLRALEDAPRSGRPVEIDGPSRAKITALACSVPPIGHGRWTLRLLADKVVELGHCERVSHTAVRQILKKTTSSRT